MGKNKKAPNQDRLPLGKFFAFRAGGFAMSSNYITMGFVAIYCTDFLKMSPVLVGSILLISKIFDAFGELFCGYIVDNAKTGRFGKARKFDLFLIGQWACTVLLFSVPASLSMPFKIAYVFIFYMVVQSVFQSLVQAANQPRLMRGFANKNVIMKVQSYGGVVSMILSIAFNMIFPILMKNMATSAAGWTKLMLVVAIPICLLGLTRFFFVKEDYIPEHEKQEEKIKIREILQVLAQNKYIWIVAGIGLLMQTAVGLSANTFFFTYVIGDVGKMGTISMISIVLLPIMFFVPMLVKKHSVSTLIAAGGFIGVGGGVLAFIANSNMILILVAALLTSLAVIAPPYMSAVMISDCSVYNRYQGHKGMEATLAAVTQFGGNLGVGIGGQIAGIVLSISGYVGGAATQSSSALIGIRVLYGLVPATFYLLMALLAIAYRIEKKIPEMEAAIAARQQA
jgi:Na+/melibiose symporter-like transporter